MKQLTFLLIFFMAGLCFADQKSGISLSFSGEQGVNWDVEYFWHNPNQDPVSVIYIRQDTQISMAHNSDNVVQARDDHRTISAPSGYPGTIRYKVDRDYQLGTGANNAFGKYWWAAVGGHAAYPAYSSPFSFSDLTYGTGYSDDSNSQTVVGGIGSNGNPLTNRENYYYGFSGPFGDEWHTIAVADDDTAYQQNAYGRTPSGSQIDFCASDHKVYLFVVNPKTPCLKMTGNGQWYTTPAKVWWVPKIHSQTSYIDSNVNIRLTNITNSNPIYFRIYQSGQAAPDFTAYTTSAIDAAIANTANHVEYTLEYYFDPSYIKKRIFYKNPHYPSGIEAHGYRFWGSQARADAVKASFSAGGSRGSIGYEYQRMKGTLSTGTRVSDGRRFRAESTGEYALVAWADGLPNANSYAAVAKHYLLDNMSNMEIPFFQYSQNRPNPCPETYDSGKAGYRVIKSYLQQLLAYDLLISIYKATDQPGGITPVEDFKIRDTLAKHVIYALRNIGEYYSWLGVPRSGMWRGTSEHYAAICAHILPSYSTPYYGTSGFDGNTTTYTHTPYHDESLTWKEIFYDQNTQPRGSFPNRVRHFRPADQIETTSGSCGSQSSGQFHDRVGYFRPTLYGIPLSVYSSYVGMNGLSAPDNIDYVRSAFSKANNGTLYGVKDCSGPQGYHYIIIHNAAHPTLYSSVTTGDLAEQFYLQRPWGIIYYDPDYSSDSDSGPVDESPPSDSGDVYEPPPNSEPVEDGTQASGEKLTTASVTASADDGNVPSNTIDDDLGTRWSAEGSGQWIQYDLGALYALSSIDFAFFNGDERIAYFDILTSVDGNTWVQPLSGQSSGTTLEQERYDVSGASARYVRIVGNGNSVNYWNSITEVDIYGTFIEGQLLPPNNLRIVR